MRPLLITLILFAQTAISQPIPPWELDLRITRSADGKLFNPDELFQDSAGVPSICRHRGDTLLAVFQWFRGKQGDPTFDRVAVKYSYDDGQTWTEPTPIRMQNFPLGQQRPFDPTLVKISPDSFRIFFSSSYKMPAPGEDSIINCYSAISTNGVDFTFENGPRVDDPTMKLIDPAVIRFKGLWHYAAPKGAPQDGAWHYISSDGFNFTKVPIITSTYQYNWTGNYMIYDTGELRFYGSGSSIWYNSSKNGGQWDGYVSTNIKGGDPSAIRLQNDSILMVYVGMPKTLKTELQSSEKLIIYPNPSHHYITFSTPLIQNKIIEIYSISGQFIQAYHEQNIDIQFLEPGVYLVKIIGNGYEKYGRFVKPFSLCN